MNKFREAFKNALNDNNLVDLLSGNGKYGGKNNYPLRTHNRFSPELPDEQDPIDVEAIYSAFEYAYLTNNRDKQKKLIDKFYESLITMISSDNIQEIYLSTRYYIVILEKSERDPLYVLYELKNKLQSSSDLFTSVINQHSDRLKQAHMFKGKLYKDGLYGALQYYNNWLSDDDKLHLID